MTTAVFTPAASRVGMSTTRKIALATGVLFIITYITSIPAQLVLYHPLLSDPAKYIASGGADPAIALGALLEMILVVANIGTAVVLYPLLKRQNQIVALGYVTLRVVEAVATMVGIVSVLSVLTLRQNFAGGAGAVTVAKTLVAIHDWTFLLGPAGFGVLGTGVLLGYLMFTSGLVPRQLAVLGLVGGPLDVAATVGVVFGLFALGSAWQSVATIPEFLWELSFGIYCTVKGFRPSPISVGFEGIGTLDGHQRVSDRA